MDSRTIKIAVADALPIGFSFALIYTVIGYLYSEQGVNLYYAILSTVLIFAVPMQIALKEFTAENSDIYTVIAVAFFINSRFFIMSTAMLPHIQKLISKTERVFLKISMLILCTSNYALICSSSYRKDNIDFYTYAIVTSLLIYIFAIIFTIIGHSFALSIGSAPLQKLFAMLIPIHFVLLTMRRAKSFYPLLALSFGFFTLPMINGNQVAALVAPLIFGFSLISIQSRVDKDGI